MRCGEQKIKYEIHRRMSWNKFTIKKAEMLSIEQGPVRNALRLVINLMYVKSCRPQCLHVQYRIIITYQSRFSTKNMFLFLVFFFYSSFPFTVILHAFDSFCNYYTLHQLLQIHNKYTTFISFSFVRFTHGSASRSFFFVHFLCQK